MKRLVERLKRVRNPTLRYILLRTRGSMHYAAHGHIVRRRAVDGYLSETSEPKLHLGAGPFRLPGWLNTDLLSGEIYLDVSRRLPFRDARFAYVFAEHLIEHLPEERAEAMLREIVRVLRPGGVFRVTTPDLRKLIAIYEDSSDVVSREQYAAFLGAKEGKTYDSPSVLFNDLMRRWGHEHIYDENELKARLNAAGFSSVERVEPGESRHEALRGLERHGGEEWVNRAEAMTLEATRA